MNAAPICAPSAGGKPESSMEVENQGCPGGSPPIFIMPGAGRSTEEGEGGEWGDSCSREKLRALIAEGMPSPIQSVSTPRSGPSFRSESPRGGERLKLPDPLLPPKQRGGYTSPVLLAKTETACALQEPLDTFNYKPVAAPRRTVSASAGVRQALEAPPASISSPAVRKVSPSLHRSSSSPLRHASPSWARGGVPLSDPELDADDYPFHVKMSPSFGPMPRRSSSTFDPVIELAAHDAEGPAVAREELQALEFPPASISSPAVRKVSPSLHRSSSSPLRHASPSWARGGVPLSDPELDADDYPFHVKMSPSFGPMPRRSSSTFDPVIELAAHDAEGPAVAREELPAPEAPKEQGERQPSPSASPISPKLARVLGSSRGGELPALPTPEVQQQAPSRTLSTPPGTKDQLLVFKHNSAMAHQRESRRISALFGGSGEELQAPSLDNLSAEHKGGRRLREEDDDTVFALARLFLGGGSPVALASKGAARAGPSAPPTPGGDGLAAARELGR
eukprot:CAMPEP_0174950816 /NCGR_PEP_ID=MMETSP1355-20121228/94529_1 /TAXON_ID=464990 /ORGANISM="Hemiselmis tepida, Strain CCMP443" /LENGTH=507 /DNA_ID=CAMNT_0016198451 /DNA_START=65 /DNA_END=1585 /DNA_ORIENTATION=+